MNLLQKLEEYTVDELTGCPKKIVSKDPVSGFKGDDQHLRAELYLEAEGLDAHFRLFIRRHVEYEENFSIGLDYKGKLGEVPLIRYNGPHMTVEDDISSAHYSFHIHSQADLESTKSRMDKTEITDKYNSYIEALHHASKDLNILNFEEFFPHEAQIDIFED